MLELLIILGSLIVFLLLIILIKLFTAKAGTPELGELRKQLEELKTKQLEAQNTSLRQQQNLFISSQKEMRESLQYIMKSVSDSLTNSQGHIHNQLKNSNEVIGEIQQKLGSLETTTKNIQDISKDISSLQEILSAPKLRGNLGEYLLEELLRDILPPQHYAMQYRFKNGTTVDAIIRLQGGIVPIDSKFPLESFQRLIKAETNEEKKSYKKEFISSVKKRIDEIASRYIIPSENTFDFAMMYIPAENVFYETIINDGLTNKDYEIFNYAIQRHIIPVSPQSFYAYLMAIAYGLKGFRIEQEAKHIIGELSRVQDSFARFLKDFSLLGSHIGNAESKYADLNQRASKMKNQLEKITGMERDEKDN